MKKRLLLKLGLVALLGAVLLLETVFLYRIEQPNPETVALIQCEMNRHDLLALLNRPPDQGNIAAWRSDWLVWNSRHGQLRVAFGADATISALIWDPNPPNQSIFVRFQRWMKLHRESKGRQEFRE
jgi:hypothetical protein